MHPYKHPKHNEDFEFLKILKGQGRIATSVALFFGAPNGRTTYIFMFIMPRISLTKNFSSFGAKLVPQKGQKPLKKHLSALFSALELSPWQYWENGFLGRKMDTILETKGIFGN